jgi:GDP-L-fucose synthase|tara:strand:- start:8631 stop:9575 length:945 start_codon:yes stop_codon:yes gene_type:complete
MDTKCKIYVAGHKGMVGSAICRKLSQEGYQNIIVRTKQELDLTDQCQVREFFQKNNPEYVFLAAAKVGGITHNKKHPANFIRDNLLIQTNVIDTACSTGVIKLCFLGSACIYPKLASVPIKESDLLTGELEETNIAYAIAKIAGYTMCHKYTEQYGFNTISLMPSNLYGHYDNFKLDECHVIPALIRKFIDARNYKMPTVECYGDGSPTREFLHVDDLADAALYLMHHYNNPNIINVGSGIETSIKTLSENIKQSVGYEGDITWNTKYPNGTPKRYLDVSKINSLGWKAKIDLLTGLQDTVNWFEKTAKADKRV